MLRFAARSLRWGTALAVVLVLFMWVASEAPGKDPERPSDSITIVDVDGSTVKLSMDDMSRMLRAEEKECICVGENVGFIGIFDYEGVRLKNILQKAKAALALSDYKQENLYVVFRGTDGYQVIESWPGLRMTAGGDRAMVAVKKDGKPLPPDEGQFRLFFPADKYVGRSVKCLETIEIRLAPGAED